MGAGDETEKMVEMHPINDGDHRPLKPRDLSGRWTLPLFIAVIACAFGSPFQFGYNIGVINAPGELIKKFINSSHTNMFGNKLDDGNVKIIWSIIVSIFAIGGMIGGLMSGWVADRFGRKGGMLLNNIFAFISAVLLGTAKVVDAYPLLIIGRLIIGFNSGLNSGLAPMYLTEISSVNLRGTLGSVNQLFVTVAILVSQIVGLAVLFGTEERWPILFALIAVPALFQVVVLPLCPESPKYNLIVKHRREQAEKDLLKLRQKDDVSAEIDSIQDEADRMATDPKVKLSSMFKEPWLRWPLFIAVMLMLAQQLSGINVAMYYSTQIFKETGLEGEDAKYATIGMGALNVLVTIFSVWLVDHPRFGRRTLLLIGLGGMFICTIFIVLMLNLKDMENMTWAKYMVIVFTFIFVASFATGPGSIPWFYVSELFLQSARSHANSIAVMTNWFANFVVGLTFPLLQDLLKNYTFLVFTFFLAAFWLFTFKFVPETKGVPIEEMVKRFQRRKN